MNENNDNATGARPRWKYKNAFKIHFNGKGIFSRKTILQDMKLFLNEDEIRNLTAVSQVGNNKTWIFQFLNNIIAYYGREVSLHGETVKIYDPNALPNMRRKLTLVIQYPARLFKPYNRNVHRKVRNSKSPNNGY